MNKQLSYTVWLRDKTQAGYKSIGANLRGLQRQARGLESAWQSVGTGAAASWASGQAIQSIMGPAREMNAARGELASLVNGDSATLNRVQFAGMKFASEFGESATEFVRSAYNIQSAIAGLNGKELARFTNASAVLAKATKADTETVTSYMGAMYGIFEKSANKMGKAKWVEQIAGQTAMAVKIFRTDGKKMADAFEGLGSLASNQNISAAEQFSVLGMLSQNLSGSEAGTAYASFMEALPNAQKTLKMNFAGEDGKALGMTEIIKQLKSRYGSSLNLAEQGEIGSAFGSEAAKTIYSLWDKTDALTENIRTLSQISNMQEASKMARDTTDHWDRLRETGTNIRTIFGQVIDGILKPFVVSLVRGMNTLQSWMVMFPNITKAIGYLTIGFVSLGAAMALVPLVKGLAIITRIGFSSLMAITGIKTLMKGVFGLGKSLWGLIFANRALVVSQLRLAAVNTISVAGSFVRAAATVWIFRKAIFFGALAKMGAALSLVRVGLMAMGPALLSARLGVLSMMTSMRAATLAGMAFMKTLAMGALAKTGAALTAIRMGLVSLVPMLWSAAAAFIAAIGWVPLLIVGIGAGITALVLKWDDLVASFSNTAWFEGLKKVLDKFMGYLSKIGAFMTEVWDKVTGFFASDLSTEIDAQAKVLETGIESRRADNGSNEPRMIPQQYLYQSTQNNRSTSSQTTIGALNINTQNAPSMAEVNAYMAMVAG
ncbi:phage tail tape measure protein [Vibrio jasicida]|uniref:phage tail tape measure protein n=1 Tax=Vibrio jasicida TaxID=766224 RepID=UPI000698E102|nr:phage tail tape measure protein [Vibrio jasicida]